MGGLFVDNFSIFDGIVDPSSSSNAPLPNQELDYINHFRYADIGI